MDAASGQRISASFVVVRVLSPHEIFREDNYAEGFDAAYIFKYRGPDVGYAESKAEQALIYEPTSIDCLGQSLGVTTTALNRVASIQCLQTGTSGEAASWQYAH